MHSVRPYRHGNLPAALVAAARQLLDETGMQAVGLRETARRVGVSATAAYRHFASKEDLIASVAAEGFLELGAAMEGATRGPNALSRAGLAYVEFAQQNRGLFRLMFGPVLAERAKYPALLAATNGVEALPLRGVADRDQRPLDENLAAMARLGPRARALQSGRRRLHSGGARREPGGADPGRDQTAATVAPGRVTALVADGRPAPTG